MNIRRTQSLNPGSKPDERCVETPEQLRRMIEDVQRSTKLLQAQISHISKKNQARRNQNKRLKQSSKAIDTQIKRLVDKNLKVFEQKIEAQKSEHPQLGISCGISPFAISRLPSFKFEPGLEPTICLVCYAELDSSARCKTLPDCRHTFHSQCVKEHLMVSKFCPGCGAEVHL